MTKPRRIVMHALAAAVILLGLRVIYVFASYILGHFGAQRFHVESATLLFVACAAILSVVSSRSEPEHQADTARPSWWIVGACCALSVALYWPALVIGFLSDDFVLVTRAEHWQLGPVTPALFRPLPLLLWALSNQAGGGPLPLHLLNVMLHAINGFLAAWIVGEWLEDRIGQLLVAVLVVTMPLAVEAVAWCSGIFDVLATTFILVSILISRSYGDETPLRVRVLFITVTISALASKETAAIGFLFVLFDAWARRALRRALLRDICICAAIVATFSVVRFTSALGIERGLFDKYLLQRAVFGSFGGLAAPWHIEVVQHDAGLAIWTAASIVVLVTVFVLLNRSLRRFELAVVACTWILLPILPIFSVFYVAPDLQGSRYLYLSGVGWSALLVVLASGHGWRRVAGSTLIAILVGCYAFGVRQHLRPWIQASHLRDAVETAGVALKRTGCNSVTVVGAPDTISGAYVFRNGLPEAFAEDLGLNVAIGSSAGTCTWRWDESRQIFAPTNRH